jgi:hypothetical protein
MSTSCKVYKCLVIEREEITAYSDCFIDSRENEKEEKVEVK